MAPRTQSLKPSAMSSKVKNRQVLGKKTTTDGLLVKAKRKPLQDLTNLTNPVKAVDNKVPPKPNKDKAKSKPLGDLTNSSKLLQRGGLKSGLKMPSLAEETEEAEDEADEIDWHDHQKCIEAQENAFALAAQMDWSLDNPGIVLVNSSPPIVTPKYSPSPTTPNSSPTTPNSSPIVTPKYPPSPTTPKSPPPRLRLEFDFSPERESPMGRYLDQLDQEFDTRFELQLNLIGYWKSPLTLTSKSKTSPLA